MRSSKEEEEELEEEEECKGELERISRGRRSFWILVVCYSKLTSYLYAPGNQA